MILNERDARHEHILQVARQMMTAARTAPKGKGIDIIEVALITDEEIKQLSDTMIAMVKEHGMKFFLRDADNILNAECVILIGTREQAQGLKLRVLWICYLCRTYRRSSLRIEQHRRRYRHRFCLCYCRRFACRHTCDVLCRIGSTTPQLAERLQNGYGNPRKRILQESVL